MTKYDPINFTYGYEVEWGDIDRQLVIPEHLGKWEYAETDIVNLIHPYKYVACDPLGLQPRFGGEINMRPTTRWSHQVAQIMELKQFFIKNRCTPTTGCVNHGHLHIHVPGLKEDTDALKRLTRYIQENQQLAVDACYQFKFDPEMRKYKGATQYLKYDGGRLMPDYMCENIINKATNFEEFIKLHAAGKDGVSMGRPFRYAINMYCMKHTGTIEFRCFRSTTNRVELECQFLFASSFLLAGLNDGISVAEILRKHNFGDFPRFYWSAAEYDGWLKTKYDKSRGKKQREYIPCTI